MQHIFTLILAVIVTFSSPLIVVGAVQIAHRPARWRLLRAATFALGWTLLVWPFAIAFAYLSITPESQTANVVPVASAVSMLFGSVLLGSYYLALSIMWQRRVATHRFEEPTDRALTHADIAGFMILLAATALIATQSGVARWIGMVTGLAGALTMVGAKIASVRRKKHSHRRV